MPTVTYCLAAADSIIDDHHPLWSCAIPDSRRSRPSGAVPDGSRTVSFGRYFSAVHQFCSAEGWMPLARACSLRLQRAVAPDEIGQVRIHLEKHGAFYHPSRLRVAVGNRTISFVVNVAVSDQGRRTLPCEVRALGHLTETRPFGWFPQVYHASTDPLPMFLADWFDGFHEFHLTRRSDAEAPAAVIWDGAEKPHLLDKQQAEALYRNAAMILSASYDPVTSQQIHPWHHAAGDFVVRLDGNQAQVKMITVRNYAPLAEGAVEYVDEAAILEALIVFFMHLSVRMRLDRRDGVSEVLWAPDSCLKPMVRGFFQGLDLTARINGFPEAFPDAANRYFNRYGASDLLAMAERMTASIFDVRSEERQVVQSHLDDHVRMLFRILSSRLD